MYMKTIEQITKIMRRKKLKEIKGISTVVYAEKHFFEGLPNKAPISYQNIYAQLESKYKMDPTNPFTLFHLVLASAAFGPNYEVALDSYKCVLVAICQQADDSNSFIEALELLSSKSAGGLKEVWALPVRQDVAHSDMKKKRQKNTNGPRISTKRRKVVTSSSMATSSESPYKPPMTLEMSAPVATLPAKKASNFSCDTAPQEWFYLLRNLIKDNQTLPPHRILRNFLCTVMAHCWNGEKNEMRVCGEVIPYWISKEEALNFKDFLDQSGRNFAWLDDSMMHVVAAALGMTLDIYIPGDEGSGYGYIKNKNYNADSMARRVNAKMILRLFHANRNHWEPLFIDGEKGYGEKTVADGNCGLESLAKLIAFFTDLFPQSHLSLSELEYAIWNGDIEAIERSLPAWLQTKNKEDRYFSTGLSPVALALLLGLKEEFKGHEILTALLTCVVDPANPSTIGLSPDDLLCNERIYSQYHLSGKPLYCADTAIDQFGYLTTLRNYILRDNEDKTRGRDDGALVVANHYLDEAVNHYDNEQTRLRMSISSGTAHQYKQVDVVGLFRHTRSVDMQTETTDRLSDVASSSSK
ncbi:MAG: hypothetical protein COB66_05070 [Coxiella sp. (in: Bacteria)]|nr:MAG: hypothetical protein COB66_05070 [Coxiella sp. (in: g-proteobacteria)]